MSTNDLRAAIEAELHHAEDNEHILDRDCQGLAPGERRPAVSSAYIRACLARYPESTPDDELRAAIEALADEVERVAWAEILPALQRVRAALTARPAPTPEQRPSPPPPISNFIGQPIPANRFDPEPPTPEAGQGDGLAEVIAAHPRRHVLARGVERCGGCGTSAVGQPGWHSAHVADAVRAAGWVKP